ncbi:MAG: choice-of-anchor I family protein [Opitutales bacterium]|nr:choice-of-anchor I family protein [Opitutales bacterium]
MKSKIASFLVLLIASFSLNGQNLLTPSVTHTSSLSPKDRFDESAYEIPAFDPITKRVFISNDANTSLEVLQLGEDSGEPTLTYLFNLDLSTIGGGVNAVSVSNGLVAVAVQNDNKQANGKVAIFSTNVSAGGSPLATPTVGALPDHLTFTNDGTRIVVANEGEPNDDYDVDPKGSVSIIYVSGTAGLGISTDVTTLDFTSFDNRKNELLNKGVRIFGKEGNATVSEDLEPEYIALTEDDSKAFVGLQENNAYAVIDLESDKILDIIPFGLKDHARGKPSLKQYELNSLIPNWPSLGTPESQTDPVMLGGFSGLWVEASESDENIVTFYAVPDRGPNADNISKSDAVNVSDDTSPLGNLRPFKLPNYQGRIAKFRLYLDSGKVSLVEQIMLHRYVNGVKIPITGRGNAPGLDEVPVAFVSSNYPSKDFRDVNGNFYHALDYDPYGGDFEGVLISPTDGSFWMCDEYRPAIYKFSADGNLTARYIAQGTAAADANSTTTSGYYGTETLPAVYQKRRANRGFEGLALDHFNGVIYAFIQTPMYNPSSSTKNKSDVIRIIGINETDGSVVSEYVYLLERNRESGYSYARTDKIGDAVFVGTNSSDLRFLVMERDSTAPVDGHVGHKYIYEIDLLGATNLRASTAMSAIADRNGTNSLDDNTTLEQMTADQLVTAGIKPVFKQKILNLPSIGYLPSDKPEGLAVLPDGSIAVINDNDFGLAGAGVSDSSTFGIISFDKSAFAFDANNKKNDNNKNEFAPYPWPVLGMLMPDSIASYQVDGVNYIVTANEGDARDYDGYSEEIRTYDIIDEDELNSTVAYGNGIFDEYNTAYPASSERLIKKDTNLGRLKTTKANGDLDGDGEFDRIFSYGARSFSIFDEYGNLVFDSGSDFERITYDYNSSAWNLSNDVDGKDDRSDDKGPEPEGLVLGKFGDRTFAFIGLERIGGVIAYDITDPFNPEFLDYVNNRDLSQELLIEEVKTDDDDFNDYNTSSDYIVLKIKINDDDPDEYNFLNITGLGAAGDLAPEGLVFVPATDSPTGTPLLIVANEVSGTTTVYKIGGDLPLHPVTGLTIRPGNESIHLQWEDNNHQEEGYRVLRKEENQGVFVKVADLSPDTTNWSDNSVISGKTYAYRVDAYNANYTSSSTESELFAPIKPILNLLSTYNPAKEDYAEVPAFDPLTNRIFVSNGKEKRVDVMELDRKGVVTYKFSLPIPSTFGGINAVSVSNGILAVAVEAPVKQNNGGVLFYDTRVKNGGSPITTVSVGALPDHLTFTPDGLKLVVANEGEPSDDYTIDPKGSISIIDVSKINQIRNDASSSLTLPVTTLDFTAYDSKKAELIAKGVRIFGKNASVSQDLEPEYVAISADSTKAFVTLQENNALAFVDLLTPAITDIKPLGYKDYNALGLAFDSNDKDKSYNPYPWPVLGMYQPDSIVSFTIDNAGPPAFQEVNSAYTNSAFTGGSDAISYKSRSIATLSMTGAEISDYDPANKILYVVGGGNDLLTVDLSNPANPVLANNISLGATAQSVAVKDGYVAIALSNSTDKTQNGTVALYTVATKDKNASLVTTFTAGALPDSVAFSNDGNVIVVANEGEPNDAYTVDPEGSITVIRLNRKNPTASVVHQLGFSSFTASNLTAAGVRLSGPNNNVPTKDLEPEYVTIAPNGEKAFVSLQENNAIAIVDLLSDIPKIESVVGAGIKDWSVGGLKVDTTDKDSGVNFGSASFKGLNMPDGMDSYTAGDGRTYFIAANEGDGREYEDNDVISYTDENRSKDFGLTIGGGDRIKMTTWDKNGDGSISADERFAFGGRSFTIYDDEGTLVFDSGDLLDTKANEVGSYPDGRSDDKGSEPEGVEIANIGGRSIAFIAMERSSTVAVFDVTNPKDSVFLEMIKLNASLVSPEGLKYISAEDSGNGKDLLVISAEYLKGIEIIEFSPPSAIDVFSSEFLITANEGDAREYYVDVNDNGDYDSDVDTLGYIEETRVGKLNLDFNGTGLLEFSPDYPDAEQSLTADKFNLSRLKTTTANGDIDGDGKYEEIYSYGARSFSIWSAKDGSLVYDSGVDLEKIVQQTYPDKFNIDDDDVDKRSDDKGVEPEGLAVGKVDGRTFAFIGLERQSGIIIYDVTDPLQPQFVQYANNRDYSKDFDSKEAGDVGPEGLTFVSADNSPTGYPLLIVTNEVSGSTSVWGMSNLPVGPVKGLNIHQDADVSILSWDDTSSVENGFIIYRKEGFSAPFVEVGRVGRNVTSFYDVQIQPGEFYSYKVHAYNDVSESRLSQVKSSQADIRLTILHANDAEKLMPTTLGNGIYGGAALFVSTMKELRSEFNSKGHGVLSISAGDNLMPGRELSASTLPLFSHFMDQAGFEFAAIGNHEFDAGPDTTATFIKSAKNPTFLSSNLDFSAHKPLNELFTNNKIVKSTLVDVAVAGKTIKVGLVGATTKNLSFISSPSPVTVDIDVASKVQSEVNSLSANGAKVIILVSHLQGVTEELSLLTQVSGVDVVVAGGGDNLLANPSDKLVPGDYAQGSYPLIGVDKDGSVVPVVTVEGQLKYIGRLTLNISSSGDVTGWSGGPNRVVDSAIDQFHGMVPDRIAYETIEKPVNEYVSGLATNKISNAINFALIGDKNDIRARETNVGNLVADSQLWVAQTYAKDKNAPVADVAVANGGGIRDSINSGGESGYEVSVDDTYRVLPFGNIVTVVPNVSAAEFKLLLENAYSKTVLSEGKPKRSGDGTGRFAQIAGFKVEYDITAKPMIMDENSVVTQQGVRVVNATMNDGKKIIENGIPADNLTLNVAIVDFLADNKGDQYFTFRSGAIDNIKLGFTYQAALAEYISAGLKGDLSKYEKPDGRIKFDAKASSDGVQASSVSGFFPGAKKLEGGWKELSWFGSFWDQEFPWIYHAEHGWLYAGGTGGASMWFYDLQTGWWWTNEQHYPYVYLNSVKDWIFYQKNAQSKNRFFYLFSDGGNWVTYPKSGQ